MTTVLTIYHQLLVEVVAVTCHENGSWYSLESPDSTFFPRPADVESPAARDEKDKNRFQSLKTSGSSNAS